MALRAHIIIIGVLIATMFLIAQMIQGWQEESAKAEARETLIDETYYIDVIRATWGMNCHGKVMGLTASEKLGIAERITDSNNAFVIAEDNALKTIKDRCNRKKNCSFKVIVDDLGFDPAPGCPKELYMEYRCFSYDTMRKAKAHFKQQFSIDCSAPVPTAESK